MEYPVIIADVAFEEEIKQSKFITYLHYVEDIQEARDFVDLVRQAHPKAVHHCWAAIASAPQDDLNYGFSDDGEPSGTAGRPMFNTLQGAGVGNIVAVCVRYFGGILLGTGGLVRAYSNGVQQALKLAEFEQMLVRTNYQLSYNYDQNNLVQSLLNQFNAVVVAQEFGERIDLVFAIAAEDFEKFNQSLSNRSSGALQAKAYT